MNNAQKCEVLWDLAAKRCWLSHTKQVFKEWCQSVVLFATHRKCAILTTTVPSYDIPLMKRQKVCGLANSSKLALYVPVARDTNEGTLPIKLN